VSRNLIPSEQLDRGIMHLELLTKLFSAFVSDSTNTLDQTDQLVLVEMLEDVTDDLFEARNRLIDEANKRYEERKGIA
jgi:hypothetical protein